MGRGQAGQVLRRLKAIKSPSDRVVKAEVLGYRSGLGPTIDIGIVCKFLQIKK